MITIKQPEIIRAIKGRSRLTANVVVDDTEAALWFEVDSAYESYLCAERCDAFVLALLLFAYQNGHDIVCESPMTGRLYEQLVEQFLLPFYKVNGFTRDIEHGRRSKGFASKIICGTAPEVEHPAGGCHKGSGISCGVDSLHVFAVHPELDTACIWSTGILTGVSTEEEREEQVLAIQRRAETFCEDQNLALIKGWTNYDGGFIPEVRWEAATTYGNLFCVFALQKYWSKYYIASGYDIAGFFFFNAIVVCCCR